MKVIKTTSLVATAFALVALAAGEASAQAPTVTSSQNGNRVTIQWNGIAGATSYDVEVSGSLSALVQVPTTFVTADAPPGNYVVRVRARAGGTVGPFSDPINVAVGTGGGSSGGGGGGGCAPGAAPTVTATTAGGVITVTWTGVAGATGYRLEFSRTPGGTEAVQNVPANQTTYTQFVPMVGTFYVRVIALGCNATSTEQSFTISSQSSGSGPRTPDPPAGSILPRPPYGQDVVTALAAQYAGDLANSCTDRGGNHVFMYRVVHALRQRDSRWGMNQKRGNQGLSHDIVTYNPTALADAQAQQIYLWDIIGNHCPLSGAASWNWADVTGPTWQGGQTRSGGCSNDWCALWYIPNEYFQMGFR